MRPTLAGDLTRSLLGVEGLAPESIIVVVNGVGGLDDPGLEAKVKMVRLPENLGPAGGFKVGITEAFSDPDTTMGVSVRGRHRPPPAAPASPLGAHGAHRRLRRPDDPSGPWWPSDAASSAADRTRSTTCPRPPRRTRWPRPMSAPGGPRSCPGGCSSGASSPTPTGTSVSRTSTGTAASARRASKCSSTWRRRRVSPPSRPPRAGAACWRRGGPPTGTKPGAPTTTPGIPSPWPAATATRRGTSGTWPTRPENSSRPRATTSASAIVHGLWDGVLGRMGEHPNYHRRVGELPSSRGPGDDDTASAK